MGSGGVAKKAEGTAISGNEEKSCMVEDPANAQGSNQGCHEAESEDSGSGGMRSVPRTSVDGPWLVNACSLLE